MTLEEYVSQPRILHGVFLVTMVLMAVSGEVVAPHSGRADWSPTIVVAFTLSGVAALAAALSLRRRMIGSAMETLRRSPADPEALRRWKSASVVSATMSEAIALHGFCLRVLGIELAVAVPFYLGGLALLILTWPRRPE